MANDTSPVLHRLFKQLRRFRITHLFQLKENPVADGLLLTVTETLAILGGKISSRSLWRWSAAGRFPKPVRLGGRTLWKRTDVEKFVLEADGNIAAFNRQRRQRDA